MIITKKTSIKALRNVSFALILLSLTTANLPAWGPGVHAYIADRIGKKAGWKNVDEMYGAMAPDVINYMFYSPYLPEMYFATHFDFKRIWKAAQTPRERALAYGFLTHNNAWAADYSAHTGSLSLEDHAKGYVIQKAELLAEILEGDAGYASLGIPCEITLEICHNMIENSVELLMAQVERDLGKKVVLAVRGRSNAFPRLLARAYSPLFAEYFNNSGKQAAEALVSAETVFRQIVTAQGYTLQQDLPVALDQMAELNAQLAEGFLAQYGVVLPEDFDSKGLIADLIVIGMTLCQDDFEAEVSATVKEVEKNMARYGYRFPK
jgi:hypothetical protein